MIRTTPRPYQKEAVMHALSHDGFLLLGEQRTGKTLTSLMIVDHRKPDILFVVCPQKAILEWNQQIERHMEIDWDCQIEIINYEACSRTKEQRKIWRKRIRKWYENGQKIFTICDEAHRIKKPGSFQSRFMRSISPYCEWRLGLTGTAIAQGIQDCWALLEFANPDSAGSSESFKKRYLKYGGYKKKKIVGYEHEEEFAQLLHTYSHRITLNEARKEAGKSSVKVRRKKIWVELKPSSWEAYRELEGDLETEVRGATISVPQVLNLTSKLQQLAGGFLIHERRVVGRVKKVRRIIPMGMEKIIALEELLYTFKSDQKLVICARFIHELQAIAKLLDLHEPRLTYKMIAGGKKYDNRFDTSVILLQVQSGIAIDLSAANIYIFYSWDHSYINYEQSKFRIRSFNTDQVNYYYLMGKDTIDEQIYEAVTRKRDLATLICDKYRRKKNVKLNKLQTGRNPRRVQ